MKKCPNCGAVVSDDSLYCGNCGNVISQIIKCPNCGKEVNSDVKFCSGCGCLLNEQGKNISTNEALNSSVEPSENSDNTFRKYYIIVGIVIVFLVFLSFYIFKGQGSSLRNSKNLDTLSDSVLSTEKQDEVKKQSVEDVLKLHSGFKLLSTAAGDFDGDGKVEILYTINPKSDEGPYVEYIYFSKKTLPEIKIETHGAYVPNSEPSNAGDLDGDGCDEIAFYSSGYESNWNGYYIWSYKNGKWIIPIEPVFFPVWLYEDGYIPVRKSSKKGYVEVDYNHTLKDDEDTISNENTYGDVKFERKIVKFNNKGYKVQF